MKKLLAAVTCLLTLVLLPLTAAAEANILDAPEEFYGACPNIVNNFDGPLVAYSIQKPSFQKGVPKNERPILDFKVKGISALFHVHFVKELKATDHKRLMKEYENLFVVFTLPSGAYADAAVDYLLVFHGYYPPVNDYICIPVTDANRLPAESKRSMPKPIQQLMDMTAPPSNALHTPPNTGSIPAKTDYRSSTAESMKAACGEDFVNGLPQNAIGYRVTGTVETISTGRQFFTIEGGAYGVNYDVAVPKNPDAALLLKPFANSKDPSETAVFAVFGPSNVKGNNVSITLYAFDKYNPRGCFMLTPPESVFLLPQHLPPQVNKMLTATH